MQLSEIHRSDGQPDAHLSGQRPLSRGDWVSLVALLLTGGLQLVVTIASGSIALLGDTLHNFADALTALPLWLAFSMGRRRPTVRFSVRPPKD